MQLLAAVAIDANDDLFPLAYGIAEGETKETWRWLMDLLLNDIGLVEEYGWTLMSDQQKVSLYLTLNFLVLCLYFHYIHIVNNFFLSFVSHPFPVPTNILPRTDMTFHMTTSFRKSPYGFYNLKLLQDFPKPFIKFDFYKTLKIFLTLKFLRKSGM
ncbi:MULE domain-containing protein [Cephalotus follicularis]|uniref:MULE domain-containing protein n=1 Tax=Cephalotus follicularis TaxID=3775 RepID=A0A1Q3BQB1_CEPFO|nr:MULE domain-containing protein [Cephalotus follicularis]